MAPPLDLAPPPPAVGALQALPALDHLDLLAPAVAESLACLPGADEASVVRIDPDLGEPRDFAAAYGVPRSHQARCLIVSGRRSGEVRFGACVLPADTRPDLRGRIRTKLDVRRAALTPPALARYTSGMHEEALTPFGLPCPWRLLVDSRVARLDAVVIGSGRPDTRLVLPGLLLAELPGVELVDGLGIEAAPADTLGLTLLVTD